MSDHSRKCLNCWREAAPDKERCGKCQEHWDSLDDEMRHDLHCIVYGGLCGPPGEVPFTFEERKEIARKQGWPEPRE